MTYSNTSLNKTFFNDVKRIFNGLECLNPFISMKNRFQKWPFFHRFSTKSPRGYAGAKVLSSMCLRAVKTWGLGRRVSSVAAGHFWAELLPPNVRWAIRIDFRWEWWFNGILWWFNGILWWFNGILWWFNGILWDLMEFNGIYPLVNIQKTMERFTMLLMGKLTISMAIFNCKLLNYQRVKSRNGFWEVFPDFQHVILDHFGTLTLWICWFQA